MKLLFAASECAPFLKTGGLGDVAGALPKELAKKGIETAVVLPYFTHMPEKFKSQCIDVVKFYVNVGWRRQYCGVKKLNLDGVTYYFIDNLYYFGRESLYGYYDDGERFAFLSLAIIELMERIDFIPDILHVNDFHTAMVPFLLKEKYRWIKAYNSIRTVLTIHNIEFQGSYSKDVLHDLFGMGLERYYDGSTRFGDGINYLKSGIMYADHVNTVSPSYAQEIKTKEFAFGLDGVLRLVQGKLSGIVNGIDYDFNNPEKDKLIPSNFSADDLTGKAENKLELQKKLGLPIDESIPIIGIVSRLTYQKGFNLVLEELHYLFQKNVQVVLLGTGDAGFESSFRYFAEQYPDKMSAQITFDIHLAQLIYAGSDMFLMPSATEPCGLSQMIAMRYGTIPIVHEIGGLKDTVTPYNAITKEGTGFGFASFQSYYLMNAINSAIELYINYQEDWEKLRISAMKKDFSWTKSSQAYIDLYKRLV